MTRRNSSTPAMIWGAFLVFGLHVVAFLLYLFVLMPLLGGISEVFPTLKPVVQAFLTNYTWLWPLFLPGAFQLIYILPLILWLYREGRREWVKGIIIGAVLTMFLNGSCYLWIFVGAR